VCDDGNNKYISNATLTLNNDDDDDNDNSIIVIFSFSLCVNETWSAAITIIYRRVLYMACKMCNMIGLRCVKQH